jgi:hypothetical protein
MGFSKFWFCFGKSPRARDASTRGRDMVNEAVGPIPGAHDVIMWLKSMRVEKRTRKDSRSPDGSSTGA